MSTEIEYPATCAQGHPPVALSDSTALQNHLTSAHPGVNVDTFKAGLTSSKTAAEEDTIKLPQLKDAYSAWGINASSLASLTSVDISLGTQLTVKQVTTTIEEFGRSLNPKIDIELGSFLLEFFVLVLMTGGSNELKNAGVFTVRGKDSTKSVRKWTEFFDFAKVRFINLNLEFTPRKMMRTCDDLFWKMWEDDKVVALDNIRRDGSPLSRRWTLSDGTNPKAYVLVPDLFNNHLTETEREVRRRHQSTITKVSESTGVITYEGLDQQSRHLAFQAQKANFMRAIAGTQPSQTRLQLLDAPRSSPAPPSYNG